MKHFFKISFFLFIVCLLCLSCKDIKKATSIKVDNLSTGKAAEILIIINDNYWTGALKDSVHVWLTRTQPILNQVEPMFDYIQSTPDMFLSQYQTHRNILYFDINQTYSEPKFEIQTNPRSEPQIRVNVKASNPDTALKILQEHIDSVIHEMYDNDLKRVQCFNIKRQEGNLQKMIKNCFGIQMIIPNTYTIAREESNFIWALYRTQKNDRMITVYSVPYHGEKLTKDFLIKIRNEMYQKYIEGAVKNAYPKVCEVYDLPSMESLTCGSKNGLFLRGLWDVVGDKMGGPFINFSFIKDDKLISIDGFVYAPMENKRDYMRECEAIVRSVK